MASDTLEFWTKTKTRIIALRSVSAQTRILTICEKKRYKNKNYSGENEQKRELLKTKKTKTKNLGKPHSKQYYANLTWHSNANCERKLASSSSTENSSVVWHASNWLAYCISVTCYSSTFLTCCAFPSCKGLAQLMLNYDSTLLVIDPRCDNFLQLSAASCLEARSLIPL